MHGGEQAETLHLAAAGRADDWYRMTPRYDEFLSRSQKESLILFLGSEGAKRLLQVAREVGIN